MTSFNGNYNNAPRNISGLILARGGSKSLPLKNLVPLGGKPLLSWALGSMLEFGKFDSVWVSTDHDAIADCAQLCGAKVFRRSPQFAQDSTPSILAVQEFLEQRPEVDIVGLIQCTSPFLQPDFLDKAYKLILDGYDSVFSVSRQKKFRWKEVCRPVNPSTTPLNFDPANRPRRQDWKGEVVENGMFYFARRSLVCEKGLLQGDKCTYVEVPTDYSLEIDSALDLAFAEQVLAHEYIQPYI